MASTTTEAVSHAAGQAAESPGMPQLDFATFPNQIFWLVVALVAIFMVLSRVALPRIAGVLAERSDTISNDIAAAEELKLQAIESEKAYDQALLDARAEAQKIVTAARAEIQVGLDEQSAKADAEISARTAESEARIAEIRAGAAASVEEVARDTTRALVSALGGKADAKTVAAAVAARMKG